MAEREPTEAEIEPVARAIYEAHWGPVSSAAWPAIWDREKKTTFLPKQAAHAIAAMPPPPEREALRKIRDAVSNFDDDERHYSNSPAGGERILLTRIRALTGEGG